jgi:prevent-host-death family protein
MDLVYHDGMAAQVNIHEAKTHFSKLLARVSQGEEIIIARNGKPLARLVPMSVKPQGRPLGIFKGQIWMAPDFDETPQEIIDLFYK